MTQGCMAGKCRCPPAHHKVWSYENNSRLKTNRSVHFFYTVRCTKNGQITFIYLQPVSVTIFLETPATTGPVPCLRPPLDLTAMLGTAPAIPSSPTDLQIGRK